MILESLSLSLASPFSFFSFSLFFKGKMSAFMTLIMIKRNIYGPWSYSQNETQALQYAVCSMQLGYTPGLIPKTFKGGTRASRIVLLNSKLEGMQGQTIKILDNPVLNLLTNRQMLEEHFLLLTTLVEH